MKNKKVSPNSKKDKLNSWIKPIISLAIPVFVYTLAIFTGKLYEDWIDVLFAGSIIIGIPFSFILTIKTVLNLRKETKSEVRIIKGLLVITATILNLYIFINFMIGFFEALFLP